MFTSLIKKKTTLLCFIFSILALGFTVLFGEAFYGFRISFTDSAQAIIERLPVTLIFFLLSVFFILLSGIFILRLLFMQKWIVAFFNLALLGFSAYCFFVIFSEPHSGYYLSIVLGGHHLFYDKPMYLP